MKNVLNLQKKQPILPTGTGIGANSCTSSLALCCHGTKE